MAEPWDCKLRFCLCKASQEIDFWVLSHGIDSMFARHAVRSFSDLASSLLDLDFSNANRVSLKGHAVSVLFIWLYWVGWRWPWPFLLSMAYWCVDLRLMRARFCCPCSWICRRCATCPMASELLVSKSGRRSVQGSISLFLVIRNLVIHRCHPLCTARFHELHEAIQKHCFSCFDKMRLQKSLEIIFHNNNRL